MDISPLSAGRPEYPLRANSSVGGRHLTLTAKRIESLAGATLGVMQAGSLAVALIGQALALARGLITKHAIKQVDPQISPHF